MATYVDELGRTKRGPLFARRPSFLTGGRDLSLQKNRRRRALRVRHVLFLVGLQAVFFLALREAYLFLITWDQLAIRRVEVVCAKPNLHQTLENHFAVPRLGNILLCDLQALRRDIRRLAWVKDVSIRKVFPSSLRVTVVERAPFALLERNGLSLADEEGHVLEPVYSPEEYGLPVISDENGFASGFFEKWEAASRCYLSLPPAERARLAGIRCAEYGSLELAFKDDPVRVVVGRDGAAESLALFRSRRQEWEGRFGPLAVADLSFEGRVYLRAAEPDAAAAPNLAKETE
jgi:cell division septal protein FtsQ